MDLDRYASDRLTRSERRTTNQAPRSTYRSDEPSPVPEPPNERDTRDASGSAYPGTLVEVTDVFQPLPRKALDAFAGRLQAAPRFVLLIPIEAGNLEQAVNLAVLLGRSLRHMPEMRARDELVMDVQAETFHDAFCDLVLPGNLDCLRQAGHPGKCEAL
ncbi:hypothetical protein I0C86_27270 [Plantactinospora sp. S1510]|uniref:Uncharacterized protein n=1 Tax=Plantactinospora alkalitolerans TaxID=2789879 RepID=A0ABS0H2D6_9ACTN|nr:hypothetical protein [Plantactinospora alkalitolerans]MBF9132626.1 hypothetical protein [Plantactinospora alkalitolerans]